MNLVFPEDCRVCGEPLKNFSRIPVCDRCVGAPAPFIAEHFCAYCHTPFLNSAPLDEDGVCRLCRTGLSGFDSVFAYGEYAGALRSLIHLFKYGGVQTLAPVLAKRMMLALPRGHVFDVIVPMPLHWRRRWRRGFNQAELLAVELGRRLVVPVRKVLRKRKATPAQAGLTSAQRRKNVAGAFEVRHQDKVKGGHILLIDDVFTTGATASACAAALKRAGAERVTVLTLARADRRRGIVRASA